LHLRAFDSHRTQASGSLPKDTFSTFQAADRMTEEFGDPILTSRVTTQRELEDSQSEEIELRDTPALVMGKESEDRVWLAALRTGNLFYLYLFRESAGFYMYAYIYIRLDWSLLNSK
jgi:hypothetical protein